MGRLVMSGFRYITTLQVHQGFRTSTVPRLEFLGLEHEDNWTDLDEL